MHLDPDVSLGLQWQAYVFPAGHIAAFAAGLAIGRYAGKGTGGGWWILLACGLAFVLIPGDSDRISIVTGWHRIAFTTICVAACWAFYRSELLIPDRGVLIWLGQISYSVYLLHPFAMRFTDALVIHPNPAAHVAISLPVTLLISTLAYRLIERPFLKLSSP